MSSERRQKTQHAWQLIDDEDPCYQTAGEKYQGWTLNSKVEGSLSKEDHQQHNSIIIAPFNRRNVKEKVKQTKERSLEQN